MQQIVPICIVDIWRFANLSPDWIADHGSFSGAAEVLGTVQSNISNRIAHLEKELGTELVNRSNGLLTESGEIVVDRHAGSWRTTRHRLGRVGVERRDSRPVVLA